MIKYLLISLLVSCGSKVKTPVYPDVKSDELTQEINRIVPKLYGHGYNMSNLYIIAKHYNYEIKENKK